MGWSCCEVQAVVVHIKAPAAANAWWDEGSIQPARTEPHAMGWEHAAEVLAVLPQLFAAFNSHFFFFTLSWKQYFVLLRKVDFLIALFSKQNEENSSHHLCKEAHLAN